MMSVRTVAHASTGPLGHAASIGLSAGAASALEVLRVSSAMGVESWLVAAPQPSIVVLDFAFRGAGAAADPPERAGLARFGAEMLLEGAGDLDVRAFQSRLSELGAVLSFGADRDAVIGHLEVPRDNRVAAFELLRLALTRPRFDAPAIERVRRARSTELARRAADPGHVARRAWWRHALPGHPYGRDPDGSPGELALLSEADLRTAFMPRLACSALLVAAAGALDPPEFAGAVEHLFGDLPAAGTVPVVPPIRFAPGPPHVEHLAFPQSVCVFGQPGVAPRAPDYVPALVLNQVIGGGTLTSRLFREMREKRGLVYSVRTGIEALPGIALLIGRFATENGKVRAALEVVIGEWRRAAAGELADAEIADAKDHLKGSFAVGLDGTTAIAAKLLEVQRLGLDIDHLTRWGAAIEAVDPATVRALAHRMLATDLLAFAIAGSPEGLDAGDTAA